MTQFEELRFAMRVLLTGHRGYIGSVLAAVLQHGRHEVVGLDCDLYGDCDFGRVRGDIPSFEMDLRDVEYVDLLSFDAVIHLAALPEDPDEMLDEGATLAVNRDAAIRLAECSKQAGVGRFLFASTCAVYGRSAGLVQTEESPVDPLTAYAQAKHTAEQAVRELAGPSFSPIILRNATVYGVSQRMRLDTVVNDFVGSAVSRDRIEMKTDGRAWRPLMHVEDVARAYAAMLLPAEAEAPGETYNVAITEENYRVVDVADLVTELIPHCALTARPGVPDVRSYYVDGSKLRRRLPRLAWRWTLPQGIRQLRTALTGAGLTAGEWRSDKFRRLMSLLARQERGVLDQRSCSPCRTAVAV